MSWFRRIAIGGLSVLLWGLGLAGAADAAPALWVVKDANSEIYLFGTLHALEPGAQWRTAAYDAAYAQATTVWFEADLQGGDPQAVGRIVARYGVDPARRLSEKLPPDQVQALGRQVDLARIDHLRPWAAAMMLSMQPMLSRGVSVEAGADLTMTRAARDAAKTVRTFETLEDQARLFAGLSEPVELRYLSEVIRERGAPRRLTLHPGEGSLEQAWLAGDMGRLGPRLIGDMRAENPDFYEALLTRRNLAWADTLTREMAGGGVELVNVGALHMVGADGLPALMAARGFTVERVQ